MIKGILAIALAFSTSAHAGPVEAVSDTVSRLLDILKGGNEHAKIAQLCKLAKERIDSETIGNDLLGRYYGSLERDKAGIAKFKKLVPSIIVAQFYDLLSDSAGAKFATHGTVPKGSARVGVRVSVGKTQLVITVLKKNEKIVDVEYRNYSLVNTKREEFQDELDRHFKVNRERSLPVSELVKDLERQGMDKCG